MTDPVVDGKMASRTGGEIIGGSPGGGKDCPTDTGAVEMNNKKPEPIVHASTPKQPYEAPKATFVPLKLEERLLTCGKDPAETPDGGAPLAS
jgi:hypothetical protein